jgi:methyl-accepting chemotaxis protein
MTFTFIMALSTHSQSTTWAEQRLSNDVRHLTDTIETWVGSNMRVMEALAQGQQTKLGDPESIDFAQKSAGFFNTYVGNEAGQFFIKPDTTMPADYDARKRGWYQNTISANKSIISNPYTGKPSGYRMVTFASPIIKNGKKMGVAGASVLLSTISESILSDQYHTNGFAALISNEGTIQIAKISRRYYSRNFF